MSGTRPFPTPPDLPAQPRDHKAHQSALESATAEAIAGLANETRPDEWARRFNLVHSGRWPDWLHLPPQNEAFYDESPPRAWFAAALAVGERQAKRALAIKLHGLFPRVFPHPDAKRVTIVTDDGQRISGTLVEG